MFLYIIEAITVLFLLPRQHKLEEALLFSGRFSDALQALNDWLYRTEPQVAVDVPVGGEKDLVNNLIDKHKVLSQYMLSYNNKKFFLAQRNLHHLGAI